MSFYQNRMNAEGHVLVVDDDYLVKGEAESFIYGHRIERQRTDGRWQRLGKPEVREGEANVRVRAKTGQLVHMAEHPEWNYASQGGNPPGRDQWMEASDGPCKLEKLPPGRYRFQGLELTDIQLRRLLPTLRPDLKAVLYPGTRGRRHFWTIGGEEYGDWHEHSLMLHTLATQQVPGRPHSLYRVHYHDDFRPGEQHSMKRQTGYALGYWPAVHGPLVVVPVELEHLSLHWPVEELDAVLTARELVLANL